MSKQRPACCGPGEVFRQPRFFKALCDPNRVTLLDRLAQCGRPCSVSELTCCLDVDQSVVSRHLAALRDAGILEARKQGKEVRYSVRYDTLVSTLRQMADSIEACCPPEGACCAPREQKEKNQ